MEFVKMDMPSNNEIKVVHCTACATCEDSEKAYLSKQNAKATGG